jgi:hypothetical protein
VKGIFELFGLKKSCAVHVTHFHPFRLHKLTDGAKKQGAGSFLGQNLSFGSLGCHLENRW